MVRWTDRHGQITRAARAWVAEHGELPTMRQLAAAVGLAPSTVAYHVRRMREAGEPVRTRGRRPAGERQ
jgi:repressor LexA